MKLYHAVETVDQHQFLNPDTQLIPRQDVPIFAHVNSQHPTNQVCGKDSKDVKTYESLQSTCAQIENALASEIAESHPTAGLEFGAQSAGKQGTAVTAHNSELLAGLEMLQNQPAPKQKGRRKAAAKAEPAFPKTKKATPPLLSLADAASVASGGSKRKPAASASGAPEEEAQARVMLRDSLVQSPKSAALESLESLECYHTPTTPPPHPQNGGLLLRLFSRPELARGHFK